MGTNMKLNNYLAAMLIGAAVLGCTRENTTDSSSSSDKTSAVVQDATQKSKELLSSAKDIAGKSKDEVVSAFDKQMKDLDAKIGELSKKSEGYKDDAKVQADKALASLREQREVVGKKFDELKNSSQDVWGKTKDGFTSAMNNLEKTYEDAKAKFN
jgi:vacuolar-type H+-ATPase subunit H